MSKVFQVQDKYLSQAPKESADDDVESDLKPNLLLNDDVTFNVFVGSESGILKGALFGPETPMMKNLTQVDDEQKRPPAIKCLSWADKETEKELLVSLVNRTVKIYNTKLRAFTTETKLDLDDSPLVALSPLEDKYLVGLENGKVSLWNIPQSKSQWEFSIGSHLSNIRRCSADPLIFATGGKENDLKVWNLSSERPEEPVFKARNVPHVLELRIPVWVQDMTFLPQTSDLIAICSRHGHLRLYDTKMDNRCRPVVNMEFCDHPCMSISSTRNDRQVIVGTAQGKVGLVDIRNYGKEKIVHLFHGFNGSVRNIVADENTPYFASCGVDRHLYIHHLNERKPFKKIYLKSRLNCLAITKDLLAENSSEDDVEIAWQHIDMNVLPQIIPLTQTSDEIPTKRKKSTKV